MSGAEIAQIITSVATLAGVIGGIIVTLKGNEKAGIAREANRQKIEEVHVATNSMKDELVKATAKSSFADGVVEGRSLQQGETDAKVK